VISEDKHGFATKIFLEPHIVGLVLAVAPEGDITQMD
jgi:hypothetical protein